MACPGGGILLAFCSRRMADCKIDVMAGELFLVFIYTARTNTGSTDINTEKNRIAQAGYQV